MEGIVNRNHNNTTVKEAALLVLTLIAAGEGNHPAVKKTLNSILSRLDQVDSGSEKNDFSNLQHPDVIPFKSRQTKKNVCQPRSAPPQFRIFSPCDDEDVTAYRPQVRKSPQLSVYVE